MTKVTPLDFNGDASTARNRIGSIIAILTKVFGIVSKQFEQQHLPTSSVHSLDSADRAPVEMSSLPVYQQSSTRRLAFGSTPLDSSKPQKDFYNNNTLVNLSKMFCAIVLVTAFVLVMTRSFTQFVTKETNSTNTDDMSSNFPVASQQSELHQLNSYTTLSSSNLVIENK